MAKVFIEEFAELPIVTNGQALPAGKQPSITTQVVAIGGASAQSAVFNVKTKFVRIHTDAICSYLIGDNPTATADTPRMAANATEYFAVAPGQRVAIITNV